MHKDVNYLQQIVLAKDRIKTKQQTNPKVVLTLKNTNIIFKLNSLI